MWMDVEECHHIRQIKKQNTFESLEPGNHTEAGTKSENDFQDFHIFCKGIIRANPSQLFPDDQVPSICLLFISFYDV